ncbi:translation initiation factor eIF-3, subunit D [Gautieria morchelliformis]|nr:translation initiation factor eIF-3, subunit D [Gautieria morchelliformis]
MSTTPSFSLPEIHDNQDGAWGPSSSHLPAQFKDIPYAPYSKSDKLGRFADWNDIEGTARAGAAQPITTGATRGGTRYPGRGREQTAFGSGTASAFAYFHVEDEASFSLVDNKTAAPRRGGPAGFGRGRGARGTGAAAGRGGQRGGRGGYNQGGRNAGPMRGGRRGWRDWEKNSRIRESSVAIDPNWKMLEEVDFVRLAKLRLDVDEPETVDSYGRLFAWDKVYDRVSTKMEKPLQAVDRLRYNPTTSDDPVIQQIARKNTAKIYATDAILSLLMCAPRSVYPWDIVVLREGDKVFLDKRDGGPFDFIAVNENASDPPVDDKDSINSAGALSVEATYVNQNYMFQTVKEEQTFDFSKPNPFYSPDEVEPLASCGYRYRVYDLGITEDEDMKLAVRTEVDAFMPGGGDGFMTIRTLNEFDARAPGAGGAPDWRTKLDSQRGAVVATEMKNNSCKLAKWAVQSILAGAETLKIGYVSRANPKDKWRHVILSTVTLRPSDFAGQLNVSLANGWGIVRTVTDLCLKQPDGKYVLIKDPNRPVIRLYSVPMTAFTGDDEGDEEGVLEGDEPESAS